jgi:hypothetical protein
VNDRYRRTLELLSLHGVDLVVVGGIAAVLQGVPLVTFDLDVVHRRTGENVDRLVAALAGLDARYRGDPRGLVPTRETLLGPGHHLLSTTLGPLDLLGTVAAGLAWEDLVPDTVTLDLAGFAIPVLALPRLIAVKEATGRPKDLAALPTLRATLEEIRRKG